MTRTVAAAAALAASLLASAGRCAFFPGRITFGENEFPELSGRMKVRAAVAACETNQECAGFSYMGTPELDRERHVGFFRFVSSISVRNYRDIDWTSYHVDREIATYAGQMPDQGQFTEFETTEWYAGQRLKEYLLRNNGSAVAFSSAGRIRFYDEVDLSTMKRSAAGADEEWNTYFNLNSRTESVLGLDRKKEVDFCCPKYEVKRLDPARVRRRGQIPRVRCDLSREEFVERFVRPMRPAVLIGCDYRWLEDNYDVSVEGIAKLFHDNATLIPDGDVLAPRRAPAKSYTLLGTPNDFEPYMTWDYVRETMGQLI